MTESKARRLNIGGAILLLLVVIGVAIYWANRSSSPEETPSEVASGATTPGARGTTGAQPTNPDTPGGHDPQPTPSSTPEELEHRSGHVVTELGDLLDEKAMADVGRQVHVTDVDVDTVDSPKSFWVRDGSARVQVIANDGANVRPGQQVTIVGTAERSGEVLRIRATSVKQSDQ